MIRPCESDSRSPTSPSVCPTTSSSRRWPTLAVSRRGLGLRFGVGDGPLLPAARAGRALPAHARVLHAPRRPGGPHQPDQVGHPGDRRHLPEPRPAGQDRHHPRRHQRGAGHPRHRRRLVRRRARRTGCGLPARGRAHGPARGSGPDLPGDVPRRGRHLRGPVLPVHEARNLPRPVQPGGPPILIGGGGREAHAATGGPVSPTTATSPGTSTPSPTRWACCASTARPWDATRRR